jgi:hypothetical protein
MASLFGNNPPLTIDHDQAARIVVDALMTGWSSTASFHGIAPATIERIHRFRHESSALENAITRELVAVPVRLYGVPSRIAAWCSRPVGAEAVQVEYDGETIELVAFRTSSAA